MEHAHHYADVRPAETYAGRRVFIIGKQNSGFELATGLLPWARQLVLVVAVADQAVGRDPLARRRPGALRPAVRGPRPGRRRRRSSTPRSTGSSGDGGDGALTVHLRRTDGGGDLALEVDEVISATGFVAPLLDLPDLGLSRRSGRAGCRPQTPWWESATVPGIFFAGTIGQGAKGLQRHGMPANSGAVHGARYNARVLAGHIAPDAVRGRAGRDRPIAPRRPSSDFVADELAEAPELFHQRGYLARVLTADPAAGWRDDGVQPLAHVLDAGGPTPSRSRSRPTGAGRSTRSCSRGIGGDDRPSGRSTRTRSLRYDTDRDAPGDRRGASRTVDRAVAGGASRARSASPGARPRRVQRLEALREREPELRPAELRPREERRAGHGRDTRVADQPHGEGDVVLVGQVADVGHHVVRAGRLVDAGSRPSRRAGSEEVAPLPVAGDEVVVVGVAGSRAPTTAAAWSGAAAPTVRKSWTRRMPTVRSGGAIVQPMRQPVTEYVFDIEWIETVRSAMPGQRRERDVLALEDDVLVDVVGEGDDIELDAQRGDELELVAREHLAGRVVRRVDDDRRGSAARTRRAARRGRSTSPARAASRSAGTAPARIASGP